MRSPFSRLNTDSAGELKDSWPENPVTLGHGGQDLLNVKDSLGYHMALSQAPRVRVYIVTSEFADASSWRRQRLERAEGADQSCSDHHNGKPLKQSKSSTEIVIMTNGNVCIRLRESHISLHLSGIVLDA